MAFAARAPSLGGSHQRTKVFLLLFLQKKKSLAFLRGCSTVLGVLVAVAGQAVVGGGGE
jgi:hypothetical protein